MSVAAVVFLFNRSLAGKVISWQGFSPAFALIPFGLLVLYGLGQANYRRFQALERTNDVKRPVPGMQIKAEPGSTVIFQNWIQPPSGDGDPDQG